MVGVCMRVVGGVGGCGQIQCSAKLPFLNCMVDTELEL